ncbi:MAG: GtrA family protein [Gammaproteobacteria bacterium]|nr:GtrA family protein [Gammaproteobacteria bacterium]
MLTTVLRFAISGGLATAVHAGLFVGLIEGFSVRPVGAAGLAFVAALLVSYGMNYHWTFSVSAPHRLMLPRFIVVALLGLLLNLGITYAVVDLLGHWYGYALMGVVMVVPLMTFALSKWWVFRVAQRHQAS